MSKARPREGLDIPKGRRSDLSKMFEREKKPCDHIPMKAAIDDEIGCIRCGKWLGKGN